jgi:hypothetical protein
MLEATCGDQVDEARFNPQRRVAMEPTLSIEQFNCLLHSSQAKSQLLQSLQDLTYIEDPDFLKQATGNTLFYWGAW